MAIAVFPGSFDPITHGHVAIIDRAAGLFDTLFVALGQHDQKTYCFDLAQRLSMAQAVLAHITHVQVCVFRGLLVDFCHEKKATVVVRGLRNTVDFEYEMQMAAMNHVLCKHIDTVFFMPHHHDRHISASLVRQIAKMGGDVSPFVDPLVAKALGEAH